MLRLSGMDPFARLKLFNLFMFGSWSLLNPFLPLYFSHAGFDSVQIGLLMSVGPLVSLVANPFWGYWSDRLQNPRKIILIMLAGNLLTSQLYFQTPVFGLVFALMLLFYFFQTALNPLSNSLTLFAIEGTSHHFGTFRLWGSIGFAVMVIAASPLIALAGIGQLGWFYGVMVALTLLLGFGLPNQRKRSGKQASASMKEGMRRLLGSGVFVLFLVLSIVINIPVRMNNSFISLYIAELGGSEVMVGWSWCIGAAIEVPLFMLLDKYLKLTKRTMFGMMALMCAVYAVRWHLMTLTNEPYQVIALQLLHGVAFSIVFYTGTQICNALVPREVRSSGQAIYGLCWMGIAGITSGVLGGWLFDRFGPDTMYAVCMFMAVAAAGGFLAIWLLYRRRGEEAETAESI